MAGTDQTSVHDPGAPVLRAGELEALLQQFEEQSVSLRSIVVVHGGADDRAVLMRLLPRGADGVSTIAEESVQRGFEDGYFLDSLAREARQRGGAAAGTDLLLVPTEVLEDALGRPAEDFSFRAVAVLHPQTEDPDSRPEWKQRRGLFDRGLICIGSVPVGDGRAFCFLESCAVRSLRGLNVEPHGHVSFSVLPDGAGFANQLFRYACTKLYAIRHGLTAFFPPWGGNEMFGLEDESCDGLDLPVLMYDGFSERDREFWDFEDPPVNIDLRGYFQEIPSCWRKHRALLRRLFELPEDCIQSLDDWRDEVTEGGRRTLVAIHIRRGDYRDLHDSTGYFRMAPEEWYLAWLRTIWPTLRNPVLFVATDEPDEILPLFAEFEPVSIEPGALPETMPDDIRDFEIMRRADYLAICNSSYSRMAAILAPAGQRCFLVSFHSRSFVGYEPWIDLDGFWSRFSGSRYAPAKQTPAAGPVFFFDVSDLLLYVLHQNTLTGIQRVECQILRNLIEAGQPVRAVVLNGHQGLCRVEAPALLDVLEVMRSDTPSRACFESDIHALLDHAMPCGIQPPDIFISAGAFWNVSGMGRLMLELKNSGVAIGVLIHDIIPILAPEYFEASSTSIFVKGIVEAVTFADFLLTTSEFNRACLQKHLPGFDALPVHLVAPGQAPLSASAEPEISAAISRILGGEFVLCVGTIEVRKNPTYLFNIWKMLVESGRANIPKLVFAGRKGWLTRDFLRQLHACNYLGGRIVLLHEATDAEIDLLYRKCLLTMLPSFVEGWGLPVGESLAHGKVCLCSDTGGIREAGGALADFLDPYNARDGFEKLTKYLDHPGLRRRREREIAAKFQPRTWRQAAEDFRRSVLALASEVRPAEIPAAIKLPLNEFLPMTSDPATVLMDKLDARLSADLVCISGWHPADSSGVRPSKSIATVRFRTDAPAGARLNLVLRLAARGREFRIRILSPSGSCEVLLKPGLEQVAVVPCTPAPGNLITARVFTLGAAFTGADASGSSWMLKSVLHFDPGSLAAAPTKPARPAPQQPDIPESAEAEGRILVRAARLDEIECAPSREAFLRQTNCFWTSESAAYRREPFFANESDRKAFHAGCGNHEQVPQVGSLGESIKLVRRSNVFIATSRFAEGSAFDRSRVWKAIGYLGNPFETPPWLTKEGGELRVDARALDAAPLLEGCYLNFYNGNLHNYYHWLAEGLLCLDILSQTLGPDPRLKIALPKSVDIAALIDHRGSFQAIGLDRIEVIEVAENLIQVREALWVDSDLVEWVPAHYLKSFQKRVAALHAGPHRPRGRRLLVGRKGPTRTIQNMAQLEATLARYGFETVYLEGMSTLDQLLLFQSAEFIIGTHGAGLTNLLFCEPGTRVIELMPAVELRPFFWLISQKLDLIHGLQFCPVDVASDGFQSSITVDIDKLESLIEVVNGRIQ